MQNKIQMILSWILQKLVHFYPFNRTKASNSSTKVEYETNLKVALVEGETVKEDIKFSPYIYFIFFVSALFLLYLIFDTYIWSAFIALLLYILFYKINRALVLFLYRTICPNSARTCAAFITIILICILILLPGYFFIKQLLFEILIISQIINEVFSNGQLLAYVKDLALVNYIADEAKTYGYDLYKIISDSVSKLISYISPNELNLWLSNITVFFRGGLSITISFIVNIFFSILILYFLFCDGHLFYRFMRKALPIPIKITNYFIVNINDTLGHIIKGNLFVALLQGICLGLALIVFGFESILTYILLAIIFSLVPIIGTSIIWLPCSLYLAFVKLDYLSASLLASYSLVVFLILENILKPKLLDIKLRIHPLLLFFSILGAFSEFGLSGIILGPVILVIFRATCNLYSFLEQSNKGNNT